jgi:hypothetical protein
MNKKNLKIFKIFLDFICLGWYNILELRGLSTSDAGPKKNKGAEKMKKGVFVATIAILLSLSLQANATTIDVNSGEFTIENGDVYDTVNVWNDATVTMTGGWVGNLDSYNTSTVSVNEGVIHFALHTYGSSVVDLLYVETDDPPPNFDFIISSYDDSTVNIYGYDFLLIPSSGSYFLEGYWQSGKQFRIFLREPGTDSHVILHEVPEPSQIYLLSFVFLSLTRKFR